MAGTQASVLTASFGEGHLSAARGIASALHHSGIHSSSPLDLLKQAKPDTVHILNSAYRTVITRWPGLWRKLYHLADTIPVGDVPVDFTRAVTRRLASHLNENRPAVIISTYPLYGHLVGQLLGNRSLPFGLLTMVTDSTTINRAWLSNTEGHYAVTDEHSAEFFLSNGIPPDRVHVTGFPVDPCLAGRKNSAGNAPPSGPLKILYTPSTPKRLVRGILEAIGNLPGRQSFKLELTVVLGRHEQRLRQTVKACAPEGTRIIGWTDNMPDLLTSHHLLIGKAGGASVHEALAAGIPMIIDYVVPGQEEGNAMKLTRLNCGIIANTPGEITLAIKELMKNDAHSLQSMRKAAMAQAQPDAAFRIAELAAQLAAEKGRALTTG
ncbi:MAG: hypothetical protein MK183_06835 [Verrucomicrobiales bacterium]|nr:hypothetical protein [Verrucomicrobiales bacterium]